MHCILWAESGGPPTQRTLLTADTDVHTLLVFFLLSFGFGARVDPGLGEGG